VHIEVIIMARFESSVELRCRFHAGGLEGFYACVTSYAQVVRCTLASRSKSKNSAKDPINGQITGEAMATDLPLNSFFV